MKMPVVTAGLAEGSAAGEWTMPSSLPNHVFIAEFLQNPLWEGGVAKGERALFCFVRDGAGVGIIKVQNPPVKLTCVGRTLDELLAGLELGLAQDEPGWTTDDNPLGRGTKKKK